jgi:hypothetical protein
VKLAAARRRLFQATELALSCCCTVEAPAGSAGGGSAGFGDE